VVVVEAEPEPEPETLSPTAASKAHDLLKKRKSAEEHTPEPEDEKKEDKKVKSPKSPKSPKSRKSVKSPRKSRKLKKVKSVEKEDDGRPRDHRWLFTKLLHLKIRDLDKDRSGDVDREEFLLYFVDRLDCPRVISQRVFDDIDRDKGGSITTDELLRWKNKHSKPEQLIPYFPPGYLEQLEQERIEKLYEHHKMKVKSLDPEEAARLHLDTEIDAKVQTLTAEDLKTPTPGNDDEALE